MLKFYPVWSTGYNLLHSERDVHQAQHRYLPDPNRSTESIYQGSMAYGSVSV